MKRYGIFVGLLALTALGPAQAGKYNEKLAIGDAAPGWNKLPGVDGANHSLTDLKQEIVVLVFTCNSCPVAADYEDRLLALAKKYDPNKVAVVAVNVNLVEADRLPKMKEKAKAKGFTFPYLFDETQKIAKDYGALFTPEFFVLDQQRRIAYMGALDDKSNPSEVKEKYVESAIDALLAGSKPAVAETIARGCRVRYARARK